MSSLWPWLAVAGGWRPSRAEPCHRLDACRCLGRAVAQSGAGVAGLGADRGRTRRIGRAGGRRGGIRPVDGSRCAASSGGWAAGCRRGISTVGPQNQAGPDAGRSCRVGALVLHDVHRARRRIDAGAGANSAVHGRRTSPRDHHIWLAAAGARGRRGSRRGDARRHRRDRHRGLLRLRYRRRFASRPQASRLQRRVEGDAWRRRAGRIRRYRRAAAERPSVLPGSFAHCWRGHWPSVRLAPNPGNGSIDFILFRYFRGAV